MKPWWPVLLLVLVPACVALKVTLWPKVKPEDIPNFFKVDDGIYRGGQPTDSGWLKLQKLGVRTVVKLNSKEEGADDGYGMDIRYYPISTSQQIDPLSPPPQELISNAVACIQPGTFVHCGSDARTTSWLDKKLNVQGGQDRTGLIIACYRVKHGWDKRSAEAEMLNKGFHKELLGLWRAWELYR